MRIYTVHFRKDAPADGEGFVFVREGFTWGGLIFGWLWLLYRRLWIPLILWIAAVVLLGALAEASHVDEAVPVIVAFAMQFWLGFEGNDLRRWVLDRKAYVEVDIVAASDRADAERIFFSRWKGPVDLSEATGNWVSPSGGVWPKRPKSLNGPKKGKDGAGGAEKDSGHREAGAKQGVWPRRDDERVLGLFPKPQA